MLTATVISCTSTVLLSCQIMPWAQMLWLGGARMVAIVSQGYCEIFKNIFDTSHDESQILTRNYIPTIRHMISWHHDACMIPMITVWAHHDVAWSPHGAYAISTIVRASYGFNTGAVWLVQQCCTTRSSRNFSQAPKGILRYVTTLSLQSLWDHMMSKKAKIARFCSSQNYLTVPIAFVTGT